VLSSELKIAIDRVWDAFWSEGISSPSEIIEQISYLMFLRILDDMQTAKEREAVRSGQPVENPIYTGRTQDLRWSHFTHQAPHEMLVTLRDRVFPWMHALAPEQFTFSHHLQDARLTLPTPGLLARVIDLLDNIQLDGIRLDKDGVGADLYKHMLGRAAAAGHAGQFFTPHHIIQLIIEMMAPESEDQICDPACGAGGFLVGAAEYLRRSRSEPPIHNDLSNEANESMFHGFDINSTMLRISTMNMLLHGVKQPDIRYKNSLTEDTADDAQRYSLILTNPPFAGSLDYEATARDLQAIIRTKKTELLFLASSLQLLKLGGRAAIIVPEGVLFGSSRAHIELRRLLVERHRLDAVVKLPSSAFKPYAGVSTSILFFTKTNSGGTENVWFYEVTADGRSLDDERNPLLDEDKLDPTSKSPLSEVGQDGDSLSDVLARWTNRNTSERKRRRTDQSFCVPKADIAAQDYDLSLNNYRRPHTQRKQAAELDGWRLGDFAEVLAGGVGSAETAKNLNPADVSREQRVLHPSLLTSSLPDVKDLPIRANSREPKYRLREGDIVGRDLASVRYWTVLPGDYEGVQAGQGILVIRLNREVVPREYLIAYLSSPQAEQDFPRYGTIPRIRRADLENIIIPACDGDFDSIRIASMRLGEGAEEADRIQRALQESRTRIFEGKTSADRRVRLEQAADLSSLTAQNLRKQSERYKAFQETYPYAAARAVRKLEQSLNLGERHEAAIQCAESLIQSLGIFSLALASHAGRQGIPEITAWVQSVRQGGASLGHWVGVIRAVGADARESGNGAAGLADATALQKGGKGLMADLNSLVTLRNSIRHGAGPRTRAEKEHSLTKLENLLFNSLSSSAFLARSEWVYMDRLHWLPEIGRYKISGLSLMGDHPDFEPVEFETDLPLADNSLYMRTAQGIIPLSPFCILSDCPTCMTPELYYPDRLKSSMALLKSLDRGHELESEMIFKRLASMC